MPDMLDSGVDESQVENNENRNIDPAVLLKKVFRDWKLKVESEKVKKWKCVWTCEHKRTEHVKKQQ